MSDPIKPITNIYAKGNTAAEINENNKKLMKLVYSSANKSVTSPAVKVRDLNCSLFTQKTIGLDFEGDGRMDAYVKCEWDTKGNLIKVAATKSLDKAFTIIGSDRALEDIDTRFNTSADNDPKEVKEANEAKAKKDAINKKIDAIDFENKKITTREGYDAVDVISRASNFGDQLELGLYVEDINSARKKIMKSHKTSDYSDVEASKYRDKLEKELKTYIARYNDHVRKMAKALVREGKLKPEDLGIGDK